MFELDLDTDMNRTEWKIHRCIVYGRYGCHCWLRILPSFTCWWLYKDSMSVERKFIVYWACFFGMGGNTRANYKKKLLNWGMKRAPKKNTLNITRWQLSSFHFSLCQQNKLLINFRILKYITKSHHQTFSPNLHGWHQMDCPPEIQRLDSINNKNIIWITLYNEGTERCRFTSRTV